MFRRSPKPAILFTCAPEDEGVIAPPVPAKSYLPDWFRKLPAADPAKLGANDSGLTVKRCLPFLDAMTTGWVISLAATVRIEVSDAGRKVQAGWDFDRDMISFHAEHQVRGNPQGDRPACKFHNHWTITTPPGWSCLFLDPLNRPNGLFQIAAGIVDTDTYRAPVHFPFFMTAPDGLHVVEKGSPIAQVIPFRRDTADLPAEIRAASKEELATAKRVHRNTRASDGWYRLVARARR